MTPAQEALKAYTLLKAAEGAFTIASATKVAAAFATDLPVVLRSIGNDMAESGIRNLGLAALDKAESIARDVAKRGVAAIWADLQAQYTRGEERQRKKR